MKKYTLIACLLFWMCSSGFSDVSIQIKGWSSAVADKYGSHVNPASSLYWVSNPPGAYYIDTSVMGVGFMGFDVDERGVFIIPSSCIVFANQGWTKFAGVWPEQGVILDITMNFYDNGYWLTASSVLFKDGRSYLFTDWNTGLVDIGPVGTVVDSPAVSGSGGGLTATQAADLAAVRSYCDSLSLGLAWSPFFSGMGCAVPYVGFYLLRRAMRAGTGSLDV